MELKRVMIQILHQEMDAQVVALLKQAIVDLVLVLVLVLLIVAMAAWMQEKLVMIPIQVQGMDEILVVQ